MAAVHRKRLVGVVGVADVLQTAGRQKAAREGTQPADTAVVVIRGRGDARRREVGHIPVFIAHCVKVEATVGKHSEMQVRAVPHVDRPDSGRLAVAERILSDVEKAVSGSPYICS